MLKLIDVAPAVEENYEFNPYTLTIRWGESYSDGKWFWMAGEPTQEYAEVGVVPRTGEIKSFSVHLVNKVNPISPKDAGLLVSCPDQLQGSPRFLMEPEPTGKQYFVREALPLIVGLSKTMMHMSFGQVRPISTCIQTSHRVRFGIDTQKYLNVIELFDLTPDEMVLVRSALMKARGQRKTPSWLQKLLRLRWR